MSRRDSGQALVEWMMLFGMVLFLVVFLLQLLLMTQLKVRLQRSAARFAEISAIGGSPSLVFAQELPWYLPYRRLGIFRYDMNREPLIGWKPFQGVGTLSPRAELVIAKTSFEFWWPRQTLRARAALPLEPAVPGNS